MVAQNIDIADWTKRIGKDDVAQVIKENHDALCNKDVEKDRSYPNDKKT